MGGGLAQPGFQDLACGSGQRGAALLASFTHDPHVRASSQDDVLAGEAGHFGDAQPGLDRHEKKRMIAPAKPRALVRGGQ